jgi:hypothetical protein
MAPWDEQAWGPDAGQFVIDRPPGHAVNMAFGYGIHTCLGAPLPRLNRLMKICQNYSSKQLSGRYVAGNAEAGRSAGPRSTAPSRRSILPVGVLAGDPDHRDGVLTGHARQRCHRVKDAIAAWHDVGPGLRPLACRSVVSLTKVEQLRSD